jgi:hypothetical protein
MAAGYGCRDDEAEATMARLAGSGQCDAVHALVNNPIVFNGLRTL